MDWGGSGTGQGEGEMWLESKMKLKNNLKNLYIKITSKKTLIGY